MADKTPLRVAYIMSRFPKVTETFILYEMLAVEEENVDLHLYPLMKERGGVVHEEAQDFVHRAYYTPWISTEMVASNIKFFFKNPWKYVSTFFQCLFWTIGSTRFFFGILAFYLKAIHFADRMEQDNIEHIHAHFVSHPAAVAYIIHQFTGISYSFTAHGADLQREQEMLCPKMRDAKAIVSVSEYNRELMLQFCGQHHDPKISIVRCGVSLERFQPRENTIKERFSIICTGTLHEVKGQRHLIQACSHLNEKGIDFECHFLGDGPHRSMLQELAESLNIAERIHFHGYVPQVEVAKLLNEADVFVLPSVITDDNLREGIPVALMEAMASGLPAISSNISGIPELIQDGKSGFLTEPGDSRAIAQALEKLYEDADLRKTMGETGREKIFNEFELHQNARRLINLFEEN